MKVKDLIEKLKEFDGELEVISMESEDYIRIYYEEVDDVCLDEYRGNEVVKIGRR